MSIVSGVTLQYELEGGDSDDEPGAAELTIATWLKARGFRAMKSLGDKARTGKHPQFTLLAGGYNSFPEDEFAIFIMGLPWEFPEAVVLTIKPEEGATRIWRPGPRGRGYLHFYERL